MREEIFILNLCTNIPSEYLTYFEKRGITVIDPKKDATIYNWTHILTQDVEDFSSIRHENQTIENDIQIISISAIKDKQSFVLSNGKLSLDEFWIKTDLKEFILDKFFQEYLGDDVDSQNAVFKEIGQFSVNQFFSFGNQIDRLTKASFSAQVQGLAVKSYIDHFLMYLALLHGSKKMELPVDISYADSDDAFGVQIYFSAQNLVISDFTACLSSNRSRHTAEGLLASAIDFCDFFDFSMVSSAQKISVTALWVKNTQLNHPSFMLSLLPYKSRIVSYLREDEILDEEEYSNPTIEIKLPLLLETPSGSNIQRSSKDSFTEAIASKISDVIDLEKVQKIIGTELSDDDIYQIFSNNIQGESKIIVGSEVELEDMITKISSGFENLPVYKKEIFSSEEVLSNLIDAVKIKHSAFMEEGASGIQLVKSLEKSLESYCQSKMIVKDNLNLGNIKDFEAYFLKNYLPNETVVLNSKNKNLVRDLRSTLATHLRDDFKEDDVVRVITRAQENGSDNIRVKSILKNTLKEVLERSFEFPESGVIDSKLGDEIAQRPATENEKDLIAELESITLENKKLTSQLHQIKESQALAISESSSTESLENLREQTLVQKQEFQERISSGTLSAELMERELSSITTARDEFKKSKKLQIEISQKEALFSSDIERLKKQLTARDLVISKSKESMIKLSEKKTKEIESLQSELTQALGNSSKDESRELVMRNKYLEIQNQNLSKQVDIFKDKLNALSLNIEERHKTDVSKDDIRKLEMEKIPLQNTINRLTKDLQRSSTKMEIMEETSKKLRLEVRALKNELTKKHSAEKKQVSTITIKDEAAFTAPVIQADQENKIKQLESQVVGLELRIGDMIKSQRNNSNEEKKMLYLESNIKKFTQDLMDAKNQINDLKKDNNKLRLEKTAIQNQLDRMKKDALRSKKLA